jgi:hypothetical protein
LAGIGILDLAGAILRMFLIDWMSGLFFMVNVWIIYIAYATLNWCNCTLIIVTAIIDAAMTGMMWSQYVTVMPEFKTVLIIFLVASGIKLVGTCFAYSMLKKAMHSHVGKSDCQTAMELRSMRGAGQDARGNDSFQAYGRGG